MPFRLDKPLILMHDTAQCYYISGLVLSVPAECREHSPPPTHSSTSLTSTPPEEIKINPQHFSILQLVLKILPGVFRQTLAAVTTRPHR